MTQSELVSLATSGRLKVEPPDQNEFDGLVEIGEMKLADARTESLTLAGRFDLAYAAGYSFALAALRWHGFRSDQRYLVFQAAQHTLALPRDVCQVLSNAHGARNQADYEGKFRISERLYIDLMTAATMARDAVKRLGPVPGAPDTHAPSEAEV